jgi:predicted lipoprotein with Yx(FWY)xxD motif
MSRRRSAVTLLASTAVISALLLSACGGDSNSNNASSTTRPETKSGSSTTVDVANTDLGDILVDSQGRTLYLFLADHGTTSECSGECANDWPPVEVSGSPTAGNGAEASMLGTTVRSDGKTQVTYNGHPVYRFEGDKQAGDTKGEGLVAFGAGWYALSPSGDQVSGTGSSSGSGSSSSGSGSAY